MRLKGSSLLSYFREGVCGMIAVSHKVLALQVHLFLVFLDIRAMLTQVTGLVLGL